MAATVKAIDTHAHLGECCVFGLISTEEESIRRMDENGIDATIVQPYPGATEAAKTHDRIAEMCAKHLGRFFGLALVLRCRFRSRRYRPTPVVPTAMLSV